VPEAPQSTLLALLAPPSVSVFGKTHSLPSPTQLHEGNVHHPTNMYAKNRSASIFYRCIL
jgi:hypothetical protein